MSTSHRRDGLLASRRRRHWEFNNYYERVQFSNFPSPIAGDSFQFCSRSKCEYNNVLVLDGCDIGNSVYFLLRCSVHTSTDSSRLSPLQLTPPDATKLDSFVTWSSAVWTGHETGAVSARGKLVSASRFQKVRTTSSLQPSIIQSYTRAPQSLVTKTVPPLDQVGDDCSPAAAADDAECRIQSLTALCSVYTCLVSVHCDPQKCIPLSYDCGFYKSWPISIIFGICSTYGLVYVQHNCYPFTDLTYLLLLHYLGK